MISGAAIPTERAFVMNGIVFAAILIDRLRISMRICALAALVVLVLDPASLVGVSFQMSFGAVVALIAVYETWGAQLARFFHRGSFAHKALGYCGAVAVTTVVATIGTEPFAIYHFHHLVLYSPLANVIAVPISAMWTLPWGVVACLLMPFGLEQLALMPMGWGIDATIWVAQCGRGAAGQCLDDAAPADLGRRAGRARRLLAVPVAGRAGGYWGIAGSWPGWRRCCSPGRPISCSPISVGCSRRALPDGDYAVGADDREDHPLVPRLRDRRRAAALAGAGRTPTDRSTAPRRGAAPTPRMAAGSRSSPPRPGCRCCATRSMRSSRRCRPGSAAAAQIPVADRIDTWRHGAIALWLDPGGIASRAPIRAAATGPGCRTRCRNASARRLPHLRP